jgi:uncharacterized protein YjbI with pentapeptide repeats
MIDHFALSISVLAADVASRTNVMVAIGVAAIGAVATFIVGFMNFRTQRRSFQLQKDQQDWQKDWQRDQQDWQKDQQGRQLQLMLSTQITDRFTDAINQLGSKNTAVRIGGIFALEQIARDSPQDPNIAYTLATNIAYTLATFVRESQPASAVDKQPNIQMLKIRAPDVQAAMTVLCRSPLCDNRVNADTADLRKLYRTDLRLDLSWTDLRRASLSGARLDGVNLWGSRLEGSNLRRANLRAAGLSDANLGKFDPKDSNFKYGADLSGADLTDAYLHHVIGLHDTKTSDSTRGFPK